MQFSLREEDLSGPANGHRLTMDIGMLCWWRSARRGPVAITSPAPQIRYRLGGCSSPEISSPLPNAIGCECPPSVNSDHWRSAVVSLHVLPYQVVNGPSTRICLQISEARGCAERIACLRPSGWQERGSSKGLIWRYSASDSLLLSRRKDARRSHKAVAGEWQLRVGHESSFR